MERKKKASKLGNILHSLCEDFREPVRSRQLEAAAQARQRWNEIQHPLNGLGLLEDAIVQIAALKQCAEISLDKRAVVVFCADNGVTREGISQTDSSVTAIVARNIALGRASVCRMADTCGADVIPVDIGMSYDPDVQGVLDRRIANGTQDILHGPAMSHEDALDAILTGIDLAGWLAGQGYQLLCAGEMGIGNTTTASACVSILLGKDAAAVTGKGAGLSDQALAHKIEVIREALRVNHLDPLCIEEVLWTEESRDRDPGAACEENGKNPHLHSVMETIEILRRVGGFDLLGMCGMFLGGLYYRIPVLIDGFASSVAALAAARIHPQCSRAMLASHLSTEPSARLVLEALGKEPLITAKLHLGEGTGAVLAIPLLDMALAVYRDSCTFEEGGVKAYRPL